MHDHLSFRADFPVESPPAGPAGDELVAYLEGGLRDQGAEILRTEVKEYSRLLHLRVGKRKFFIMVGLLDGADGEWLLVVVSQFPSLLRLIGQHDTVELVTLLGWIEDLTFENPRFRDLEWHTKEGWNERHR